MKKKYKLLLAIPALLAVLVAMLAWTVRRNYPHSPNTLKAQLVALEMKLEVYHLDTGTLPRNLQGLLAPDGIPDWKGPYAKPVDLADPWGNPIQYELVDTSKPTFRLSVVTKNGVAIPLISDAGSYDFR